MNHWTRCCVALGLLLTPCLGADSLKSIPHPLPHHPGNIFLAGEEVRLNIPFQRTNRWGLWSYEEKKLAEVPPGSGEPLRLGRLPVGYYQLRAEGETNAPAVSLGVLAPLAAPTPTNSAIGLDVAMAWFYATNQMEAAASLCALAGINWVRDRLTWGEMEPQRGRFSGPNRYDASARIQAEAGLRVLQVNHSSPQWANSDHRRFPLDLRDAYGFYREMARRWSGQVIAYEPWNEADIDMFGGHTGAEMAALQKAAFLGLKAGRPEVIACLNVFATPNAAQLADLQQNQAWPYFDTFNLHHYAPFDQYPGVYAAFSAVSAGRPLWVTECSLPVRWSGDERLKEPADADLRTQAERVAKTFACSLHEGSAATFYFLLPHYSEGQTQFGLVRSNLTPRPAFVALAAAGRLLAEARPLGRLDHSNSAIRAYLFQAKPDGQAREVLVAWAENGSPSLPLPAHTVIDHLGRPRPAEPELKLTSAPVFALLPPGGARGLPRIAPPAAPAWEPGKPSPVVAQAVWPKDKLSLGWSAYRISSKAAESIPICLYNFSKQAARGALRVSAPSGWNVTFPPSIELQPQERKECALLVDTRGNASRLVETVRVSGQFGAAGDCALSLRLMLEPRHLAAKDTLTLPGTDQFARWRTQISGNGKCVLTNQASGVAVDADPAGNDRWVYPTLELNAAERPHRKIQALAFSFTLLEGNGQFRVIFEEATGASYVAGLLDAPKPGETTEAIALFETAAHGTGWSKPDPNNRLDPDQIRVVKIGCNVSQGPVRYVFGNLRWVQLAEGQTTE